MSEDGGSALARYRARGSDAVMVRWVTPAVVVLLVAIGIVSGNALGIIVFTVAALIAAVRWLWVVMVGPRPLAFEVDLMPDELRVRTLSRSIVMPLRQVRTLLPTGLRPRPKGPRALATDAGTFTLFPEGPGFDGLITGLRTTVPGFDVVAPRDVDAPGDTILASGAARGTRPSAGDDAGLVPGVVAVRVFGSQVLADQAVRALADEGITALTLPAEGDLGGIRLAVKDEERDRAEEILGR